MAGKWPKLVLPQFCRTDIDLTFRQEGLNVYGEPLEEIHVSAKCNYQDKAKTVLTTEKKLVEITGTAYFDGDICPDLPVIHEGDAFIFGKKRRILEGRKNRNPDGTVNNTEIWLI